MDAGKAIVGLYSSFPQSGKTFFAKELAKEAHRAGLKAEILSFAEPLKDMLRTLLRHAGCTPAFIRQAFSSDYKEVPVAFLGDKTPRYLLQTLGTEWGRELVDRNIWVNVLLSKIYASDSHLIIVDDMRFPNEADALRGLSATLCRISRVTSAPEFIAHPSEGALDDYPFDYTFVNYGDKRLKQEVRNLWSKLWKN